MKQTRAPNPFQRSRKAMERLAGMPELQHRQPNARWAWNRSELMNWILAHQETAAVIYRMAAQCGAIVYDPKRKTWKGRGIERGVNE